MARQGREGQVSEDKWTPPEGTTQNAVAQAIGAASMCWTDVAGAGEFDSSRASLIVDGLMDVVNRPRVERATTRELLDELLLRMYSQESPSLWAGSQVSILIHHLKQLQLDYRRVSE